MKVTKKLIKEFQNRTGHTKRLVYGQTFNQFVEPKSSQRYIQDHSQMELDSNPSTKPSCCCCTDSKPVWYKPLKRSPTVRSSNLSYAFSCDRLKLDQSQTFDYRLNTCAYHSRCYDASPVLGQRPV